MNEEIYHDTLVFQTYSYLARLVAGEDIIIRWNVRGLDGPAEMNMVTRVLDVAPVKKGKEYLIPGIIFHELGHFLWDDNLSQRLSGHLVAVDEGAFELFANAVKSHYIWNIIADGYSERKTVAKYPGALKHLRLLYDEDKANFSLTGNIVIDTLNTLQLNVLGSKWNESFPYDERLSKELLERLHKARTLVSSSKEERVELAAEILELLRQTPGWSDFAESSGTSNDGSERTTTAVDEVGAVVLGAAGRQSQLPTRVAGTDGEQQQEEVKADDGEEEPFTIEEFISDNAAKILGSNKYYLETIVDKADPNGRELYIPTPDEVKLVSDVTDIWHPALKKSFKGWTFNRFVTELQSNVDGRRLYSLFSKKMEQSKAIAQTMFQQFITRANAQNIAMRRRKTTGLLDVNRLALHQIYDDVFQKKSMSPNQVNHAYVVMMDWSSSMHDSALELFHRICELIFFARLANVELDIWLYTTNDRMVRGEHIESVKDRMRDNVLLTGSIFAQVVNTKQNSLDEVMFRLMFFFINALMCKKVATDTVRGAFKWFDGPDIPSTTYIPMSGTNIFEAIQFGSERAQLLRADRKALILMTDGEDKPSFDVIMDKGHSSFATDTGSAKHVMYKGIDLLALAEAANAEVQSEDYKYGSENPFKNLRIGASYLVAEDARKNGIPLVGITWGSFTSKPLLLITRDNTIRLNISSKTLLSKNPTTYESVTNTFITKITEALLRHGQ